jgi:hypothetical protein
VAKVFTPTPSSSGMMSTKISAASCNASPLLPPPAAGSSIEPDLSKDSITPTVTRSTVFAVIGTVKDS